MPLTSGTRLGSFTIEALFIARDGMLTSVPIKPGQSFAYDKSVALLRVGHYYVNIARGFDVSPDGKRFLFIKNQATARPSMIVVANWIDEVRARVSQKD